MDTLSQSDRSRLMAKVRGRENRNTEIALVRMVRQNKITGWRRQQPVFGKPDFVFQKLKLAIFVDGCFWHGCPKHCRLPKDNQAYWLRKFSGNMKRDALVTRTLRRTGWRVLRVWEHELARKNEARLVRRLLRVLR